jgi:acyl carrier protein
MTRDEIIRELSAILATVLPPGSAEPAPEASLTEQGLESIGMVNLLAGLEERFGITVPPGEITEENFASIANLADLVLRLTP